MDFIGGILGQIIATMNVVVLIGAHLVVLIREQKVKKLKQQQAAALKRKQLHEASFGKKMNG